MVECKNREGGLNSTELNAIFKRIRPETKCSLIFTTKLDGELYSNTTQQAFDKTMADMDHEAFKNGSAAVALWDTDTGTARPFQYSLKNQDATAWVPECGKTTLLVVIFCC